MLLVWKCGFLEAILFCIKMKGVNNKTSLGQYDSLNVSLWHSLSGGKRELHKLNSSDITWKNGLEIVFCTRKKTPLNTSQLKQSEIF